MRKKRNEQTLARAEAVIALRNTLALARGPPSAEPAQPKCHWDFLLREALWLAVDFSQHAPC